MAIDKRKTLDSARRYAQRGAREKSLAQYEALLRGDPRDFKLRLEIGDVHQRWGRTEDAVAHYALVFASSALHEEDAAGEAGAPVERRARGVR